MRIRTLGLLRYADALCLMDQIHASLASDPLCEEEILVVEHPPVVTMGYRERALDLLTPEISLSKRGIDFHRIDRGGSVTVHEPGQVVLYPLVRVDAQRVTVRRLVWSLEEIMIRECARWELSAVRDEMNPGVWIGSRKVGAVGLRVSNHISKHGIALNVYNTLETFSHIVPCGIQSRGITSLNQETGSCSDENLQCIGERMAADLIQMIARLRLKGAEAAMVQAAVGEPCTHKDAFEQ